MLDAATCVWDVDVVIETRNHLIALAYPEYYRPDAQHIKETGCHGDTTKSLLRRYSFAPLIKIPFNYKDKTTS